MQKPADARPACFRFRPPTTGGFRAPLRYSQTLDNRRTVARTLFYIIADNPVGETCYYPDSDKWGLPSNLNGPVLKGKAIDYFEGEE